ncbi:MAG: hypothetical protein AMR96_06125 [Candidatus Adiutrix intracellularis]|nr:MAG: hypothetical protein AMR96_06125 [Candidatus Adiutrix intracellularis]MDR2826826.1 hypothetical protein [Candidatus Adiutrix intracellularis]
METTFREYDYFLGRYEELPNFNQTIFLTTLTGLTLPLFLGLYLSYLGLTPRRNYTLTKV